MNRTTSCPDLCEGILEWPVDLKVCNRGISVVYNKETQTSLRDLSLRDTGGKYSALTEDSDTDYISDEGSLSDDLQGPHHVNQSRHPDRPQNRNRTSTPIPPVQINRETLEAIRHHPLAFQVPPVEITVAPGQPQNNQAINLGAQRVQAIQGIAAGMGRRAQNLQQQPLQGADPALVQILQLMNNRDANRDNARKKFLMFTKEAFTGNDKK